MPLSNLFHGIAAMGSLVVCQMYSSQTRDDRTGKPDGSVNTPNQTLQESPFSGIENANVPLSTWRKSTFPKKCLNQIILDAWILSSFFLMNWLKNDAYQLQFLHMTHTCFHSTLILIWLPRPHSGQDWFLWSWESLCNSAGMLHWTSECLPAKNQTMRLFLINLAGRKWTKMAIWRLRKPNHPKSPLTSLDFTISQEPMIISPSMKPKDSLLNQSIMTWTPRRQAKLPWFTIALQQGNHFKKWFALSLRLGFTQNCNPFDSLRKLYSIPRRLTNAILNYKKPFGLILKMKNGSREDVWKELVNLKRVRKPLHINVPLLPNIIFWTHSPLKQPQSPQPNRVRQAPKHGGPIWNQMMKIQHCRQLPETSSSATQF
jgi:hypothetical protein